MNVDHLLKQNCTISVAGRLNKFGKVAEGTGVATKCRFQKSHLVVASVQKEKNSIDGIVWVTKDTVIDVDDKIVFEGANYRVFKVEPIVDRNGTTRHLEVMVQNWNTV